MRNLQQIPIHIIAHRTCRQVEYQAIPLQVLGAPRETTESEIGIMVFGASNPSACYIVSVRQNRLDIRIGVGSIGIALDGLGGLAAPVQGLSIQDPFS